MLGRDWRGACDQSLNSDIRASSGAEYKRHYVTKRTAIAGFFIQNRSRCTPDTQSGELNHVDKTCF